MPLNELVVTKLELFSFVDPLLPAPIQKKGLSVSDVADASYIYSENSPLAGLSSLSEYSSSDFSSHKS
jgi:hypothetical protein